VKRPCWIGSGSNPQRKCTNYLLNARSRAFSAEENMTLLTALEKLALDSWVFEEMWGRGW
jgi:hypothetical protein